MYSLNMPVSQLRTKVRQEFERHRFVSQLPVVDVLLFKSHAEYQVRAGLLQKLSAFDDGGFEGTREHQDSSGG